MSNLPFPVIANEMQRLKLQKQHLKLQMQQMKLQYEELAKGIVIHKALPSEIFVMILKRLCYKSINLARGTCTHWKSVIDSFNLVEESWGKNL